MKERPMAAIASVPFNISSIHVAVEPIIGLVGVVIITD